MSFSVKIFKDFGSFQLDIDISSSGSLALLGASGSGKTLTLKCIAGIIKPDRGRIVVNDHVLFDSEKKINLPPQQRNVGYMFQSYALFPNMSVKKNIALGCKEIDKEKKLALVDDMIKLFQLENVQELYPKQISGGQQQRCALARILIGNPDILLLDEPFSALDEHLRTNLEMELKSILSSYKGDVIIVTHNRDEAYLLSQNTAIISKGTDIVLDETKELFNNPKYLSAALITGCKNIYKVERIDDHTLYVPDFNKTLKLKKYIKEDITHIGIRAHCFKKQDKKFTYPINLVSIDEEPFEYLVRFTFDDQKENSSPLYYRVAKNKENIQNLIQLGFNEEDILLLNEK